MRTLLLATLMASAAMPAHAASIQNVEASPARQDSIVKISCADCTSTQVHKRDYKVPDLAGVSSMEIVVTDGKPEVVRVDKFMGGSPVMTLSKTQGPLIEEMSDIEQKAQEARQAARAAELQAIDMKTAAILPPDERGTTTVAGIDREATTAALGADAAPFDPEKLTLRLR